MDRTSRIGLFVCFVLLIGFQFALDKLYPTPPYKPKAPIVAPATSANGTTTATTPLPAASMTSQAGNPAVAPVPAVTIPETFSVLENDALKVTFTSAGAAIKEVELKKYKADNGGSIILNEQAHSNILSLSGWPGADTASFTSQENGPDGITFSADLGNGLKWQRTYAFGKQADTDTGMSGLLRETFHSIALKLGHPDEKPLVYTLDVTDTVTNTGATDAALPAYKLSVGRASPLIVNGHFQPGPYGYPGSGWLANQFHLMTINAFAPTSYFWVQTGPGKDVISSLSIDSSQLRWIGVENQFFAVLLTPAIERSITSGEFRTYNTRRPDGEILVMRDPEGYILPGYEPDIEAAGAFAGLTVPAGKAVSVSYSLYAGPKDFNRLDALGANQGELMNYDGVIPFSLLIVPMLTILKFWYLIFNNYGVAIILLTLMIKAITWPLQSIANRSGKRMQALAPKLKELQAKYKEQPEKLQTETFALYKDYGVNPFGGCLPALVQMPVFFSLYYMLQNAVELRGQSFLWVRDLTQPDSVFSVTLPFVIPFFNTSHFALHLLPIMVTALTMVMMRLTPQIGDPTQAKVAQFMPLVFLVIFYNFAAALSLYYVINNAVSIIQIYRNLKKPMPDLKRKPRKGDGGDSSAPSRKR
jgi:YidC/Oxa1 family membrane protein insertase